MILMTSLLLSVVQLAQPDLVTGELTPLTSTSELARDVGGVGGPAWVGYAVSAVARAHDSCDGVFDLERGGRYTAGERQRATDSGLFVLYRVDGGAVTEVRSVTSGCRIRAGSLPVYWLSTVSSRDSLRFLDAIARAQPGSDLAESALHAMAWHADAGADEALEALARGDWPIELREKAVFWMGAARGERGFRVLAALMDDVSEPELREKIVFALHVSDISDATPTLIRIARHDPDSEIREKALFWLAQEAGRQAAAAIADAVRDDPELEVKEKAVFALSQLPSDEGVPLLVEIAVTHPQPEIRKKAFFWLGQSGDPRALALFEDVLNNDR